MTDSITRGGRPHAVLARILDTPDLVRVVQRLEPTALARVIDAVGLEDAGEIAALMSTRQLEAVFDHDLWRAEQPGADETFDADRFALWLSVMREAGDEFAARKLRELDEDLVTMALCQQLLVLDADGLTLEMSERRSDDDRWLEKALESSLHYEIDRFFLVARNAEGFETIVQLLVTLDRDHHDYVERLLERCCLLSRDAIEDGGGLYEVLTSQEELESDVAAARTERREQQGYVSPADARSFLALARMTDDEELLASTDQDPITKAYFRTLGTSPARPGQSAAPAQPATSDADDERAARLQALIEEAHAERAPAQPRRLEAPRGATKAARKTQPLERAIEQLAQRDPALHARRVEELAYLANVLLAGSAYRGRALRAVEAAQLAMAVCERGATLIAKTLPRTTAAARITEAFQRHSAVHAFRIGWKAAHDDLAHPGRSWDDVLDELLGAERKSAGD
jgi:hypothetical protein